MSCRVVVGGQFGSEGKGKVTAIRALESANPLVVRCGGPNSGHTVNVGDRRVVLRQIPAGVVNPNAELLIAAGCVVDVDLLATEVAELAIPRDRVVIDPRAVILETTDAPGEDALAARIASTASGTGNAIVRRIQRGADVRLAGSVARLREIARVECVATLLHSGVDQGRDIIIEGTQGFGLSLLHGTEYPFVTARDTTAAAFISEVGISPRDVHSVEMVVRTYPIRVGGNSGPLPNELTWERIAQLSGAPNAVPEYTSVTRRLRRVAEYDSRLVVQATRYNRPTSIALMGSDRLDHGNANARSSTELTARVLEFIDKVERATGVPIQLVGTGFDTDNIVRR